MERPQKILIQTLGSRGDVQPYVALAKGLQEAGYCVNLATNVNHEGFLKECGIEFCGCFFDTEAHMKENKGFQEAMCNGDVKSFLKGMGDATRESAVMHATNWKAAIETFQPDLIISGTLAENFAATALLQYEIPTFCCRLQHIPSSPTRMIFGLPSLPCGLNSLLMNHILGNMWKGWHEANEQTRDILGCNTTDIYTKSVYQEQIKTPTLMPRLVCQPTFIRDILYPEMVVADVGTPTSRFVGPMVLETKFQKSLAANVHPTHFGDISNMDRIDEFIFESVVNKPVYIGWGSMVSKSPEHMVEFAVRALKLSGQRGIIQGGWANLSMDVLRKTTRDAKLIQYAEENVIFVEKAPHEWLFPLCSCIVHHGGAGTTLCALRSGVPAVVTPVFLDQYDHAYLVSEMGVGVGFNKQLQQISVEELANALKTVCESNEMKTEAVRVSSIMRAESCDGVKNVVKFVEEFWRDYVMTSRQKKLALELKHAPRENFGTWFASCIEPNHTSD